jgi:general secretion pathway protein G
MKTARGFTLIELLVVISIIGILATLLSANLNSARSRARDAQRKSDMKSLGTALRLYFNDKGAYPASNYFDSLWGSTWAENGTTYMNTVPKDPLSTQTYKYEVNANTDGFTLSSCLENKSDTSCQNVTISGWTCSSSCVFQFKQ